MGNSPSKSNAAPSSSNNVGTLNSSSTSSTTVPNSEPEPDDRKFPSYINHQSHSQSHKTTTPIKSATGSLKYKNKLQKKVINNINRQYNYATESTPSYETLNESNTNDLDLEINLSMAQALATSKISPSSPIPTSNGSRSFSPTITKTSGLSQSNITDGEFSSSFSDLFTIGSSASSSLSISPNYSNLSPIVEEPKQVKSLSVLTNPKSSHKSNHGFDIDSIIEKLLTVNNRSNNTSPILQGRNSPGSNSDFFISTKEIAKICAESRSIFLDQPSLLKLSAPVKVVGDIHGQFNDLLRVLKLSGLPPYSNYLFLGDYVDRGKQSLETILLMLCFKIKYPENFFMLRGNHESANVSKIYGFYDECKRRLNVKTWKLFVDVFNTLPIAAVINDKIFCVHGGLSPNLSDLKQIESIQRPTDIPESGLLADLLWSDPDSSTQEWSESDRGVSYIFGKKVVENFTRKFGFDLIIRGHMVVEDGYEFFARKKLVTVFSAPNYCGEFNNWGAVMSVDTGLLCSFELLKPNKKLAIT